MKKTGKQIETEFFKKKFTNTPPLTCRELSLKTGRHCHQLNQGRLKFIAIKYEWEHKCFQKMLHFETVP